MWTPLRRIKLPREELSLDRVLASGQTFHWSLRGREWRAAFSDRVMSLQQEEDTLLYKAGHTNRKAYEEDLRTDTSLALIRAYFQLDTSLARLYAHWSAVDPYFARHSAVQGIRIIKQTPWQALVSFICSSNNNIKRIQLMIRALCENYGDRLDVGEEEGGTEDACGDQIDLKTPMVKSEVKAEVKTEFETERQVPTDRDAWGSGGVQSKDEAMNLKPTNFPPYYTYPPPDRLVGDGTEAELRRLGFGYRAAFVVETARKLLELAAAENKTYTEYLSGLEHPEVTWDEAKAVLTQFKGVGPKVADCVGLFGLGFAHLVPVDVHVHRLACKHYSFPSSTLTPVLNAKISSLFHELWGEYAGWAQQVLFYTAISPTDNPFINQTPTKKRTKSVKAEPVVSKFEEELQQLMHDQKGDLEIRATRSKRFKTEVLTETKIDREDRNNVKREKLDGIENSTPRNPKTKKGHNPKMKDGTHLTTENGTNPTNKNGTPNCAKNSLNGNSGLIVKTEVKEEEEDVEITHHLGRKTTTIRKTRRSQTETVIDQVAVKE